MNQFLKFFHLLKNPHCPECKDDILDAEVCDSCNTLRQENQALRKHNDQLIQSLLELVKPKVEPVIQVVEQPKPVNTGINWRARKHLLETEDRQTAEILRKKNAELEPSIDKLEEELEING